MEAADALQTFAEISVGVVGFSAVASSARRSSAALTGAGAEPSKAKEQRQGKHKNPQISHFCSIDGSRCRVQPGPQAWRCPRHDTRVLALSPRSSRHLRSIKANLKTPKAPAPPRSRLKKPRSKQRPRLSREPPKHGKKNRSRCLTKFDTPRVAIVVNWNGVVAPAQTSRRTTSQVSAHLDDI
jgi:hypothetical protein